MYNIYSNVCVLATLLEDRGQLRGHRTTGQTRQHQRRRVLIHHLHITTVTNHPILRLRIN